MGAPELDDDFPVFWERCEFHCYKAACRRCGHTAVLDPAAITARHPGIGHAEMMRLLSCSACKSSDVEFQVTSTGPWV